MCQLPQCRRDGQAAVLKLNAGNGEADTAERCGRRDPRRPPGAQRSSGRCGAASLRAVRGAPGRRGDGRPAGSAPGCRWLRPRLAGKRSAGRGARGAAGAGGAARRARPSGGREE